MNDKTKTTITTASIISAVIAVLTCVLENQVP